MLKGLSGIDWSKFEDALGDTKKVPALPHELAKEKKKRRRAEIFVELGEERLVHQGMIARATLAACPPPLVASAWGN
jgi:hypothetical protein